MKTEDFVYQLPQKLIAQQPLEVRHSSRLLYYQRETGAIIHANFIDIPQFLKSGDLLVVNRTRVIPARIYGKKTSGGKVEILLLEKTEEKIWEVLVGGKHVKIGATIKLDQKLNGKIIKEMSGAKRLIQFNLPIELFLSEIGNVPLPPYIHKPIRDPEKYQTIFAKSAGSAAAPTAGLHFSNEVIQDLKTKGIEFTEITLHIGLDTFAPITEENIEDHQIHSEWCEISEESSKAINQALKENRRIIAVGTTSVRALESAEKDGLVRSFVGKTNLFIYPGYQFKIIKGLITNFHLPKSSLIVLVSAFMGRDCVMRCYEEAIKAKYRFYSFGDVMLIL